jgi:HEAT repeat protein
MRRTIALSTIVLVGLASTVRAEIRKKEDVPRYIKLLRASPSGKIRADAAEELGHRGAIRKSDVLAAVDPLITALKKDRDANVRTNAAKALGSIVPNNKAAVQPLMDALKDPDMKVRISAANALGMHGPEAKDAIPALREMAQSAGNDKKSKGLKRAARQAINSIRGKIRKK